MSIQIVGWATDKNSPKMTQIVDYVQLEGSLWGSFSEDTFVFDYC